MFEATLLGINVPAVNEDVDIDVILPGNLKDLGAEDSVLVLDYMFSLQGLRTDVQAAYLQV